MVARHSRTPEVEKISDVEKCFDAEQFCNVEKNFNVETFSTSAYLFSGRWSDHFIRWISWLLDIVRLLKEYFPFLRGLCAARADGRACLHFEYTRADGRAHLDVVYGPADGRANLDVVKKFTRATFMTKKSDLSTAPSKIVLFRIAGIRS